MSPSSTPFEQNLARHAAAVEARLGLLLDARARAGEIARRARGTPRIVNNLLRFTRDYALERAGGKANAAVTAAALELLEIDQHGLDDMDHRFLRAMAEKHNGGPVGLSSIGAAIGEDAHTLEEVHEPFLVQEGYVVRTPQGRVLAPKGWLAVGLQPPSF